MGLFLRMRSDEIHFKIFIGILLTPQRREFWCARCNREESAACVPTAHTMCRAAPLAFLHMASAMAAERVSRRIAVIGGGSGGVVAARFLKRAGHQPTVFEAGSAFGGVWADSPTNAVVYKNLQTNLPTVVMQSPDLDFPQGVPSYITKPQLGQYIADYAASFGVLPLTKFGSRVTSVALASSPSAAGGSLGEGKGATAWEVRWSTDGAEQSETFDAVIVANGHYEAPYVPKIPGQDEWLAADGSRSIVHSREYDDPEHFAGRAVLVVGGRSSGVDITRMLKGVASWVYTLEKKCTSPVAYDSERVTHVPLGTRLCADGKLRLSSSSSDGAGDDDGDGAGDGGNQLTSEPTALGSAAVPGPPVERVVLATGYLYDFPFLDESGLGMRFRGERYVTPLYEHLQHARLPTLGFIGVPLAVPCPIPFFECQAAYLAEAWARPEGALLASEEARAEWVEQRLADVGFHSGRSQDTHLTGAAGGCAWRYMRELLHAVQAGRPPTAGADTWLERSDWESRLATVEAIYRDRASRYPTLPWEEDSYRRCEYAVDWATGHWSVDDARATSSSESCVD